MPGMDGLQASRHIKSDETLSHQPAIVLVTAFGREDVREEAERLQLDGFLLKPVTKSMIVDTLVNVFARRARGRRQQPMASRSTRLRGARLLLAEDNEINQQIAIELLENAGATVTVANNGREAFETLSKGAERTSFHIVLMDLQMPEMDGYQATTKIRADPRFVNLPIVAMTAHATIEERQRCLAAGMNDHISKPIDPVGLLETVGRDLPGNRYATSRVVGDGTRYEGRVVTRCRESDALSEAAPSVCRATGHGRRTDPRRAPEERDHARRAACAHAQRSGGEHRGDAGSVNRRCPGEGDSRRRASRSPAVGDRARHSGADSGHD